MIDEHGEYGTGESERRWGQEEPGPSDREVTDPVEGLRSRIEDLEARLTALGVDPATVGRHSRSENDRPPPDRVATGDAEPTVAPAPPEALTAVIPIVEPPVFGSSGWRDSAAPSPTSQLQVHATELGTAAQDVPSGRRSWPGSARQSWLYAGRTVVTVAAVLSLVVLGLEWSIEQRAAKGLAAHAVAAINLQDPHISSARPAPSNSRTGAATAGPGTPSLPSAAKLYPPENILLLGSDTRAGSNAAIGANATTNGVANSDTIMVAHISADRQHVTVVSIPRDTMIPAPTCKLWDAATGKYSDQDQPIQPGERFHMSSTFSVGGPKCVVTAVQALTGLGITRMIGIDFSGFQAMVNALGGVTVNICRPVVDTTIGVVVPAAGTQTIFGFQALNLVRARHVIGDSASDLSRIRRQQVVLSAILRQVTAGKTLLNPGKLDAFLQAFTANTFTDNVTVPDLVTLAGSLGTLDTAHVTFYTLPTVNDPTIDGALDPDPGKAPAVYDALINDLPLPGQNSSPRRPAGPAPTPPTRTTATTNLPPTPTVAPQNITIAPAQVDLQIYNVTGRRGVAGLAQEALKGIGFTVPDDHLVRPATGTQAAVTVLYSAANRGAAVTVAAAVPGSVLTLTPGLGSTVRLMLGTTYSGRILPVAVGDPYADAGAPRPATSTPTRTSATPTAGATTPSVAAPALKPTDLASVNAGSGSCA